MNEQKEYRKSKIKRYRKVWLTLEGYTYLRDEKRKRNKSMTEILDLIIKNHKKLNN
jgi:hypothetical protein